jgi:RecA/RadA recombinase
LAIFETGSRAINSLLGGGIRTGLITDIFGESGSGKSQVCFTVCSNCARQHGSTAVFVDTAGTFRPERIVEISGSESALDKIVYLRALSTIDQENAIGKIHEMAPKLVVIDSLTSLFSAEFTGPSRHVAIMHYLHELAMLAINLDCAIIVTNMVRNAPITVVDQGGHNVSTAIVPSEQREFLGQSVSLYTHVKLKLEIVNPADSIFKAILLQPPGKEPALFSIGRSGVCDP